MDESNIIVKKILTQLYKMLSRKYVITADLKRLSNQLMEDVSLFHHRDAISVSVLVYSLYKIFSRDANLDRTELVRLVKKSLDVLHKKTQFRTSLRSLFDHIKKYDKNLEINIVNLIKHAQIKRGLKVYEHGLSIGQASEIIGVSKWEIMEYLGPRSIVDEDSAARIDVRSRLEFARGLFE
ncbi:MAG: hypothetical protein ACMXYE_02915 [Candidatus Woesearchaeota archaeon]